MIRDGEELNNNYAQELDQYNEFLDSDDVQALQDEYKKKEDKIKEVVTK
ncbi:hypothetical protein M3196_10135 [Fictibacillus nanhaiensis]|nr:hypothetical protein [Fictibacillus nanhaiensis]